MCILRPSYLFSAEQLLQASGLGKNLAYLLYGMPNWTFAMLIIASLVVIVATAIQYQCIHK